MEDNLEYETGNTKAICENPTPRLDLNAISEDDIRDLEEELKNIKRR